MKKRKTKTKKEFSKSMALFILVVAVIDIQLSYVLAFMGMADIAETLSITLVTEVVAVFITYCLKAYFGKKEEKKNELENKKINDGWEDLNL